MLRPRPSGDGGFSLVEILVVMLLIAILAVIAVPTYLGQREKAQDGEAKANARSLYTLVEACHGAEEDYARCETGDAALGELRMTVGTGPGEVRMAADGARRYEISAVSRAGRTFVIERLDGGRPTYRCSPSGGSCRGGGW
jgi:type IV pilus assembly protein PilA